MTSLKLLLLVLSFLILQQVLAPASESGVTVLSCKWSRARRTIETSNEPITTPARGMIAANKNFQRNTRVNDPRGARDPNEDTLDGRSEAMDKNVQESRSPSKKPIDGFLYQTKVHNASAKTVDVLFWEFQISNPSDGSLSGRRQFMCGVEIRGSKDKELEGFSALSPSEVISVDRLANSDKEKFIERAVINRVEYSDGSIWQRKDWNFQEVKLSYERLLKESWAPGTCKAL